MPAWLIVVLAAAWVGVPAIGCYLGVRSVLREIEAEKAVEARAGDAFINRPWDGARAHSEGVSGDHEPMFPLPKMDYPSGLGAQRSNPRGVGRHDWPL